jgi:hypothetical protein
VSNENTNRSISFALLKAKAEKDYVVTGVTTASYCIAIHKHKCTIFLKSSSLRYDYSVSMPADTNLF